MADYSQQRRQQFSQCLNKMVNLSSKSNVNETLTIFAGDLNVRDAEVILEVFSFFNQNFKF